MAKYFASRSEEIARVNQDIDYILEETGGKASYEEVKKILESQGTKVSRSRYSLRFVRYRREVKRRSKQSEKSKYIKITINLKE